ncbi:MAG: class I SAM-dependent methyltransferase, partial [Chitinophagales bacterium]
MSASTISYSTCPVCGSSKFQQVFKAKDFTVSQEEFMIIECMECSLRITQDVPAQDSISKYYQSEAYISHSESKKGLINQLYHLARKRTLTAKWKLIRSVCSMKKGALLDLGAGTGAFASFMSEKGWSVTGIEPDDSARKNALELHGIDLLPSKALYTLNENSFDAITLWHVLEHVHGLHDYLRILKNLLRPGGRIIVAVPNYTSGDARHYQQYWAAYDVPRHLYHFSPGAMNRLLQSAQLELKQINPMWYDAFYISLLSEQYKCGRSNALAGFMHGAISNLQAMGNS